MIGTVLSDRYRVDELLGEGAMGRVYRAEHVLMRKRVALKILHRELTPVPEIVQRFEREAMASAQIQHPHVAGATDFGKLSDGSVFLVLEYVEGRGLGALIEEGPVPYARVLRIGQQICEALEAAHTLGIVHRDLKPDNVLLVENEESGEFIKVLDFGIAKMPVEASTEGKPITQVGMVYGTPEYMAPEQALGQDVDGRADLYALGVLLYEMLAGVRPYEGPAVGLLGQQLTKPLPVISDRAFRVKVPARVEAFVRDLLLIDPLKRVPSASAARARIEALLTEMENGTLERRGDRSRLSIGIEEVTNKLDQATKNLPEPLGRVVRSRRSRTALLGFSFGAVGVVTAMAALGVVTASGDADRKPAPEVSLPAAPEPLQPVSNGEEEFKVELERAKEQGLAGLSELGQRFPGQARVHMELAFALANDKQFTESVDAARLALALDPKLNESPVIAGTLFRAAQSQAASASAFRLLRGSMGSFGADIIYDLREMPGVKPWVKKQADEYLFSEDAKSLASPALLLALDLSRVSDCREAESLVKRAILVGDRRALPGLKKLEQKSSCGRADCFPCLRDRPDLKAALTAVTRRVELTEESSTGGP